MKLNSILLFIALTSSMAWADEFKPTQTPSSRQIGALKWTDGNVNYNQAVEIQSEDGKKQVFAIGTKAKNFNEAQVQCSKMGSGWTLPSAGDAFFMTFLGIYNDRTAYEVHVSGKKIYVFWFVEEQGPYTKQSLTNTDNFIAFTDGLGSSGDPQVQSLAGTLESLALDKMDPKALTPDLASMVILREKLRRGIYVVCVKGDSFMEER